MNYKRIFNMTVFCLFVTFLAIYGASVTGYYEYENQKEAQFTEESMRQFEKDLSEGKNVNLKDYLKTSTKNYDNKITDLGSTLSNIVCDGIVSGLEGTFKIVEKLMQ